MQFECISHVRAHNEMKTRGKWVLFYYFVNWVINYNEKNNSTWLDLKGLRLDGFLQSFFRSEKRVLQIMLHEHDYNITWY